MNHVWASPSVCGMTMAGERLSCWKLSATELLLKLKQTQHTDKKQVSPSGRRNSLCRQAFICAKWCGRTCSHQPIAPGLFSIRAVRHAFHAEIQRGMFRHEAGTGRLWGQRRGLTSGRLNLARPSTWWGLCPSLAAGRSGKAHGLFV